MKDLNMYITNNLFSLVEKYKRETIFIKVLNRLAVKNKEWSFNSINKRVKDIFYKVHESMNISELELIINYITSDFYANKKRIFSGKLL